MTTMTLIMMAALSTEFRALCPTVSVSSVNGVQILQSNAEQNKICHMLLSQDTFSN